MKATDAELSIINSRLPGGATVLSSQVEILPFMMFDNKETDRATIMMPEMMKKIVTDLNEGRVAMNSMHQSRRTLPAGRSVAGVVKKDGDLNQLLAKMYVVTTRPDGSPMEDGKDLADRYNTGAVFACSAGVKVGFYKCSICGNDIRDYNSCDHWPGEVYQIDEKPVRCIAYMTGRDIQNGMAMDCGAYELSAVTAGGVSDAGILTETFGKYQDGANMTDLKRATFDSKEISEHITFVPVLSEKSNTLEENMSLTAEDVKKIVDENYGPLVQAKATLEVEVGTYKAKIDVLEKAAGEFAAKITELETAAAGATTKITEFTAQVELLTAAVATEKAAHEAVRTAYVELIDADGVKLGRSADYATMSLEGLLLLHKEYIAAIALIPAGQHSLDTPAVSAAVTYTGVPDTCFKTA